MCKGHIDKALIQDIKEILEKTDITGLQKKKLETLNAQIAYKIQDERGSGIYGNTAKIDALTEGECGKFNDAVRKRWDSEKLKEDKFKKDKEDKLKETSATQRATPARPLAALVSLIVMAHLSAQY